jgi:alpha-L-rhamnosidase
MKTNLFFNLLVAFTLLLFLSVTIVIAGPIDLTCEHLVKPLGVDAPKPRLSWRMLDPAQGAFQSAYRVYVGTDSLQVAEGKGMEWDTGKVTGDQRLIAYQGKALQPFTRYFWAVEIWDQDKKASRSVVSSFETGMMGMQNWKGSWISDHNDVNFMPASYFRNEITTGKKISSARAYIAVAGLYELYLNGDKIGNHRLDPMYTRFDRRTLYVSYDITANLRQGKNAIGVLLGNGWYNHQSLAVWNFDKAPWRARPTFCLDIRITYEDGTTEVKGSGLDWKASPSPLIFNSIYTAEHYDARLALPGWNTVGFDDQHWKGVLLRAAPSNNIVSQMMHPIRNVEEIPVKSMKKFNDTTYVFNLGRNISGVSRIRVKGSRGTVVRLRHAERLYENGRTDLSNIDVYHKPKDQQDPFQTDIFILAGNGTEEFMPKFNYKGFQYVEVRSDKPVSLSKNSLNGYFMHSDVPATGKINSSNPMLNKIWRATNNSYLSNLFGYPTDCPQREKNGWTGDGHFAVETGLYNFDGITIYEKWLADHRDEQQPNGVLPDIIPTGGWGYGTANGTDWTSTIAIIPWEIYQFYGDSKLLADCYENIKRYVNYVDETSVGGLTSFGRGDWVPVKSISSLEYTSSVYFYVDAIILAKAARLFNKPEDAVYYQRLADKVKQAINDKYLQKDRAIYASGVQTELSMALQWGIVPEALRLRVAENLAKRVAADGMHLDVGVLGAKAILNALSDNGQAETAYRLAAQDTYPSWGWWIANGATTLYENWDINAPRDISMNHMMFGEIGGWLYKGLGGIKIDENKPGFKNVLLKPNFVVGLDHFEATHKGPYGAIRSFWKRKKDKVTYEVTVPANSSATIYFPLAAGQRVLEKGRPVLSPLQVKSGSYVYEIK